MFNPNEMKSANRSFPPDATAAASPGALAAVGVRMAELCPDGPSSDPDAIRRLSSGGKGLRAQLLLDCAARVGGSLSDPAVVDAAAGVEFLHLATLIHDDVMDQAMARRGAPTLNAAQGDVSAGYSGLVVLAAASRILEGLPEFVYSDAQQVLLAMCSGQFTEAMALHNPRRTVDEYLEAVEGKTGALFGLSARLGVRLGRGAVERADAARRAGTAVGVAYQIVDDVLDLHAETARERGKPSGADLAAGVFTLPVLLARESRPEVAGLIEDIEVDVSAADRVARLVVDCGADREACRMAAAIIDEALAGLDRVLRPAFGRLAATVHANMADVHA